MMNDFRWRSPASIWLIYFCLVGTWGIASSVLASSDYLTTHGVPDPQPASAPTPPNFDQSDDLEMDDSLPADPSPATAPTPFFHTDQPQPESIKFGVAPDSTRQGTYSGKEYRFKRFVIRPAELKLEGLILATLVLYTISSYRGKRKNERTVAHWLDTYSPLLNREFSHVGTGSAEGYVADGPALFYGYATGRKGCQALTIRFALRPRQDLPFMFYEELRAAVDFSWTGRSDRLELVWSLTPASHQKSFETKDAFVWALVEKRVMNLVREERWDVRTFTEVKESNQLPSRLVFMSESGEINEQIIKNKDLGLLQLLRDNPSSLEWFDTLVLSGTPQQEPLISELPLPQIPTTRTITLRLRLPPHGRTMDAMPLIEFCFNLIDSLDQTVSLTVLAASKLAKKRAEVSSLLLDEERKAKEREKEEERRKRLKAIHDEKLAKMSPADQRKLSERERKRSAAKMGKTSVKRK